MSWYFTKVIMYLVCCIAAILAATLWGSQQTTNQNKLVEPTDDQKQQKLPDRKTHTVIFEQGGFGLGDNLMGLISLYHMRQVVPVLKEKQIQFLFQWPLFDYFELPEDVTIISSRSLSENNQTMDITHQYFGENSDQFSYEKLEHAYNAHIKTSEYWPETTVTLHCNMPLFAFDLDGQGIEQLVKQVFKHWLRPREFFHQKIQKIVKDVQVLYHIRIGDAQLVHNYEVSADSISTMLSGVEQLELPNGTVIFLASDTKDCLTVARERYPQFGWKGWEDYYKPVTLQHLTFLDQKESSSDRVLERTLVEFMLFKHIPTVVTQRWSNFSKIGLLANNHRLLNIWFLENNTLHQVFDKKDLVFK